MEDSFFERIVRTRCDYQPGGVAIANTVLGSPSCINFGGPYREMTQEDAAINAAEDLIVKFNDMKRQRFEEAVKQEEERLSGLNRS